MSVNRRSILEYAIHMKYKRRVADENGNLTSKVNAKVLESMEGSKIRLKLGDKTLITTDFK